MTRRVVEAMVDGLNDHVIDGIGAFFAPDFCWMGNAGCGAKRGLREFQDNWQRPFQAAFSDKLCIDEARLAEGEWMAAFGRQEATHSGEFRGIASTGKRVEIRYMDFWPLVLERLCAALQARGYHVMIFIAPQANADVERVLAEALDYQVSWHHHGVGRALVPARRALRRAGRSGGPVRPRPGRPGALCRAARRTGGA